MAKVLLKNVTESDITLNFQHESVTIPGAKPGDDDKKKLVHGTATVEQDMLDALENHPVVQHYFDEGWLQAVTAKKPKQQPAKDPKDQE